MARRCSERIVSVEATSNHKNDRSPAVYIVSGDHDFLRCVLEDCTDIPADYQAFPSINKLSEFLSTVPKLNLAVVLIIEKTGETIDTPALREFKLDYPQIFFIALLGSCEQRNHLRLQSLGVQNILLPPFSDISITKEISTALPNVPQFKKHPDLLKRGQMRINFLLPSDLSYVLGLNYFISLLLKEFYFPVADSRINIPLACDEAVTNAILHGNRSDPEKKVNIQIYISHSRFRIRVMDQGEGFDLRQVENPTEGEALLRPSGRGIYLMKSIMDTVSYKEGGRVVELEKLNPEAAPNNG
jgi:serine/threonine-protein kinase RsbW